MVVLRFQQTSISGEIQKQLQYRFSKATADGFLPRPSDIIPPVVTQELKWGLRKFQSSLNERLGKEKSAYEDSDWYLLEEVRTGRVNFSMALKSSSDQDQSSAVAGLIRIFDGTVLLESGRDLEKARLPTERFLLSKGGRTEYFEALRSEGYELYEIGKYFVEKSLLSSVERTPVRNGLLRWLKMNYLEGKINSSQIFIIGVSSPGHKVIYEKMFGAVEIPREHFGVDIGAQNAILRIDGQTLLQKINQILGE